MKPIRLLAPVAAAAVVMAAGAGSAEARNSFNLSIGAPAPVYYQPAPVYVAPQPVYYAPQPVYYQPAYASYPSYRFAYSNGWDRHRNYDWGYWNRGRDHGHGHH